MNRRIFVIIVAGGSGQRMGAGIPKQFLLLDGKPILQRTIERFADAFDDAKFLVVLPEEHIDTWKGLCERYSLGCPHTIVRGGISRYQSVRNALEKVPDGALVMIHDGVRPLIHEQTIRRLLDECAGERNVIPVCPVTDTLKSLKPDPGGTLSDSSDPAPRRAGLYGAQTPQIFLSEQLKAAYTLGYDESFTDDASVARAKEIPLTYVPGERYNIKITTPEDLEVARLLFSA